MDEEAFGFSVMLPFSPTRPEQALAYTALVQRSGARRLWHGQALAMTSDLAFAFAAGAGAPVPTGLGVGLMPLIPPYMAALNARSLAVCTGASAVAGFGTGTPEVQAALAGASYRSPLRATREYVTAVRGLLEDGVVEQTGEYFSVNARMPLIESPPVEIGLGVLRPRMAEVAGELADVAITWLTPPEYLRDVLVPALCKGAARAGRTPPKVTAIVPVAVEDDESALLRMVRAATATHIQGGNYISMLRGAGLEVEGADAEAVARRMVECGVFAGGTVADVAETLASYRKAGADEIVLHVSGVYNTKGGVSAIGDLKSVLAEVGV